MALQQPTVTKLKSNYKFWGIMKIAKVALYPFIIIGTIYEGVMSNV